MVEIGILVFAENLILIIFFRQKIYCFCVNNEQLRKYKNGFGLRFNSISTVEQLFQATLLHNICGKIFIISVIDERHSVRVY